MSTPETTGAQAQPAADTKTQTTQQMDGYTTPMGVFPGQPDICYPKTPGFTPSTYVPVGGVIVAEGNLNYNVDRRTKKLVVRNTGDRPIQIGSHFHFFEVNRYMEFDRPQAFGYHLNIPATTAIRFEPGEEKEVEIVQYAGKQRVIGFNNLVDGYAGLEDTPTYYPNYLHALRRMDNRGFKHESETQEEAEYTQTQTSKK